MVMLFNSFYKTSCKILVKPFIGVHFGVLLGAFFTVFSLNQSAFAAAPSGAQTPPPVQVIAYKVPLAPIQQSISVLGQLQAQQSVAITSNVSEHIESLHFKDGQSVQKNQLLVSLNAQEERALLNENQVAINEAKTQYQRVKEVEGRGNVTRALVDEKQRIWQSLLAKQTVLETALAERSITAPFSGTLGLSRVSVGSLVSPGLVIVSLDALQQMQVDLNIPEQFLAVLTLNQAVKLSTAAYPEKQFMGSISAIASQVDANSRLVQIRAVLDNPDGLLKTNMMMQARIDMLAKQRLIVPNSAVVMLGDLQFVYQLIARENGLYQAQKTVVKTGQIGAEFTEITQGLNVDALVVSQGVMRVNDKTLISIKHLQNPENQATPLEQADLLKPKVKPDTQSNIKPNTKPGA